MRLISDLAGTIIILHATFVRHASGVSLASEICPKLAAGGRLSEVGFSFRSEETANAALSTLATNLGAGMVAVEILTDDTHPQFVDTQVPAFL